MMLRRHFLAAAPPFAALPALAQAKPKVVATFSILAIALIFKPSGILGRPEVEKV